MFEINLIIYNKGTAGPGGLPSMGGTESDTTEAT